MKKILSLLLLAVILLVSVVACGGGETTTGDTTSDTTGEETTTEAPAYTGSPIESLEPADYDGYGFTFYTRSCCNHAKAVFTDAEATDIVDVATYNRNEKVYSLLNAEILEPITAGDGPAYDLVVALQSGEQVCDAIMWHRSYAAGMAADGLLLNMAELENLYFDYPWWATDLIEKYSYKGTQYLAVGHMTTDYVTDIGCMIFNKTLFENIFPENDLYDEVRNEEWTLDRLAYYLQNAGADFDNDGIYIPGDRLAMSVSRQHFYQFMYGADQFAVLQNSDGVPEFVINTDKMVSIVEKVYDMMIANPATYRIENPEAAEEIFVRGQAVFGAVAFRDMMESGLRKMEDGYGVLPYPMYDEAQGQYNSRQFAHGSLFCMPYLLTDEAADRASHIVEAMARIGYEDVTPVLYEMALKEKYTNVNDWDMMDIITEGLTADFGDIAGGFQFTLDDLVGVQFSKNFASYYDGKIDAATLKLNDTLKLFERYANR